MIGAVLDEIADRATTLVRSGWARNPDEAVEAVIREYCSDGRCSTGSLGGFVSDAWNALVGKPQSWYTNVSNIQAHLNVVLAGVTAIGGDLWNSTLSTIPSTIDGYDTVVGAITGALTSIIVTQNSLPDDSTIAAAAAVANAYDSQLAMVTAASAPDVQAQVQSDQATTAAGMPAPMQSPSAVGRQVFVQTLEERASALGQGISDVAKYLAWAVGGAFGIYALSKLSGGSRAA